MFDEFFEENHDNFYFAMRVIIGLMFAQHGAQKLFGAFGANAVELMSLMGLVGIIELFGGLFIAVGLLTRLSAMAGTVVMLGALLKVHLPRGLIPISNGGELPLVYIAAFLILMVHGGQKWALQKVFK